MVENEREGHLIDISEVPERSRKPKGEWAKIFNAIPKGKALEFKGEKKYQLVRRMLDYYKTRGRLTEDLQITSRMIGGTRHSYVSNPNE